MRPALKLVLIGGEVTVLAAFTGLGVHLAMQPHRTTFQPPPLVLPSMRASAAPRVSTPAASPLPSPTAAAAPALGPELLRKFGQQDRALVIEQWDILRRLMGAIERYVAAQVDDRLASRR